MLDRLARHSPGSVEALIRRLSDKWCSGLGVPVREHVGRIFAQALGQNEVGCTDDVNRAYGDLLRETTEANAVVLHHDLGDRKLNDSPDSPTFSLVVQMVSKQLHHGQQMLLHEFAASDSRRPETLPTPRNLGPMFDHTSIKDFPKLPPLHNLYLHCLKMAFIQGYRRCNQMMYRQKMIRRLDPRTGTERTCATHVWEPAMSMDEFAEQVCAKEIFMAQWVHLQTKGVKPDIVRKLQTSRETELPEVVCDRTVTAWRNGILFARDLHFHFYEDDVSDPVPASVVAHRYFDCDFDTHPYANAMADIQHPVRKILDNQKFSLPEQIWIIGCGAGRCIFELGELDEWEMAVVLLGFAGVGKGLIGECVQHMFNEADVGVLSNNFEKVFGLSALVDRKFVIAPDLKQCNLSAGDLQTMVSREYVNVPIKNLKATKVRWRIPLLVLLNHFPREWVSGRGQLERRLLVPQFKEPVPVKDVTLKNKAKGLEFGSFYRLALECYHDLASRYGAKDWLPSCEKDCGPKLTEGAQKIQETGNTFYQFLNNTDWIRTDPNAWVWEPKLKHMYLNYCMLRGVRSDSTLSEEKIVELMNNRRGVTVSKDTTREWPMGNTHGAKKTGTFFLGIKLLNGSGDDHSVPRASDDGMLSLAELARGGRASGGGASAFGDDDFSPSNHHGRGGGNGGREDADGDSFGDQPAKGQTRSGPRPGQVGVNMKAWLGLGRSRV